MIGTPKLVAPYVQPDHRLQGRQTRHLDGSPPRPAHAAEGMMMHLVYEGVVTPFEAGDATGNRPE